MNLHHRLIRNLTAGCACVLLLLSSCGQGQKPVSGRSPSASPSSSAPLPLFMEQAEPAAAPTRTGRQELAEMLIDPPYDFNPAEMLPSDFGSFFLEEFPVARSTKALLADSPLETSLTVIEAERPGPTVFVVAGIHGDETAGWSAGNLLAKASIQAGKLLIISPANALGAKNSTRYVTDHQDLNRSFPGSEDGSCAEQLANAIFKEIDSAQPDLLFDLHEARIVNPKADYLGSSLIYSDLEGMDALFFDLLLATQTGEICSEPFQYYSPGPDGSVNRTAVQELKIPAITVETFRGYPLERRIADQLDVVQYALRYYGMI